MFHSQQRLVVAIMLLYLSSSLHAIVIPPSSSPKSPNASPSFVVPTSFRHASIMGRQAFEPLAMSIGVGTPAQEMNLILDTGSCCPTIYSQSCNTCGPSPRYDPAPPSPRFEPSSSTSFVPTSKYIFDHFGAGNISGVLAGDDLSLISPFDPAFPIGFVEFSLINYTSWSSTQDLNNIPGFGGTFGLVPPTPQDWKLGAGNFSTNALMAAGLSQVSFWWPSNYANVSQGYGMAQFGGYDKLPPFTSGNPPDLEWFKSTSPYDYTINVVDIQVDGRSTGLCPCAALLDTGGGLIDAGLTSSSFHVPIVVDCALDFSTLPNITIVLERDVSYTLTGNHYITRFNDTYCQSMITNDGAPLLRDRREAVRATLREEDQYLPMLDFAGTFYTRVLPVFDFGRSMVGLTINPDSV